MNAREHSLRTIVADVLEIQDEEERAAFLVEACGTDSALRSEVEELVQAHAAAKSFLPKLPLSPEARALRSGVSEAFEQSSGTLPFAAVTQKLGDRICHYQLLQQIGEGGCGVIYMAEQEEPVRRRVALKVIKLGMDTKQVVARFEAERQALALMDHPNIAKVLDAGATDTGRPFFVMELVQGIKITDYCDEHRLRTKERLELCIQVCQAVQHAHQKGIIHRDLKPSNILVTVNDGVPVPKVIDFGIAKATEGRLTDRTLFTAFEQFLGTPAYMSPEQAVMTSQDIDTRSDIYSLGVLLYELLTGKTPFDTRELLAASLDELRRTIREKEPVRPSTRLRSLLQEELTTTARERQSEGPKLIHLLRGDLDWIVMKCLEKDRTRRYETASGLAADIKRYLNNEPILARPPSNRYRLQKLVRRNKLAFAAGMAFAGLLLLGALVSTWEAVRAKKAEHEQIRLRQQAQMHEQVARRRAYASDMNLAQQALAVNNLGRARELVRQQLPPAGQEDLRGWEWRYLWQQCQSDALAELCRQSNAVLSLAVSADGRWIAVGQQNQGGLSVWDVTTRQQIARLPAGQGEVVSAFSPKSRLLAFATATLISPTNVQYSVRLWDGESQQMTDKKLVLGDLCRGIRFAADGQTLLTFTMDNRLTVWRMPEGALLASLSAPFQEGLDPPLAVAATRDGSSAAYAAPNGKIRLIDLTTGSDRWTAKAADEFVTALAFSADGRTLASGAGFAESAIRLWDVASGKEVGHPLQGHRGWVGALVFWPDGKTLASGSADQTIRLWDLTDLDRVHALGRPLRGHRLEIWSLALLPDNSRLVSGCKDGSVFLWDTSIVRREFTHQTVPATLAAWRFAPDGHSIVGLDRQGRVARWEGADLLEAQPLLELGTNMIQANISQDGQLLAVATTNHLIRVWDLSRRVLLGEFAGSTWRQQFNNVSLSFQPRRRTLVFLDQENVFHEWDLATWQEIHSWRGALYPFTITTTPDEALCLTLGKDGASSARDLITGKITYQELAINMAEDVAVSPDGKFLAGASAFGFAKLWEAGTVREIATLSGFLLGVHSVTFSPDGKRLATGSSGQEAVKLWDLRSYQELLTLEGEGSMFWPIAFSPDGDALAAMNDQGTLHLWRAPSWKEIATDEQRPKPSFRQ